MNTLLTNLGRLGFLGWIVFELLNWQGVLHFTLDFTWGGLVLTASVVWIVLEIISGRLKKATGQPLPWFVLLAAVLSVSVDALGDLRHWYSGYAWYDQLAHAIGGGVAGIMVFTSIWQLVQAGKVLIPKWLTGVFGLSIAVMLGAFYELEEYLEDVITGSHRLGDGFDTANDILMNTIGAIVFILVAYFLSRKSSGPADKKETSI